MLGGGLDGEFEYGVAAFVVVGDWVAAEAEVAVEFGVDCFGWCCGCEY